MILDGNIIIGINEPMFSYVNSLTVHKLQFVYTVITNSNGGSVLAIELNGGVCTIEQIITCPQCYVSDTTPVTDNYRIDLFLKQRIISITNTMMNNILCKFTINTTGTNLKGSGL